MKSRSQNSAPFCKGKRNEGVVSPLVLRISGHELGKGIKAYRATNALTGWLLGVLLIPKFGMRQRHCHKGI